MRHLYEAGRAVEAERLADFAGGEDSAAVERAVAAVHGVVCIVFALPPGDRSTAIAVDVGTDVVAGDGGLPAAGSGGRRGVIRCDGNRALHGDFGRRR